MKPVAFQVHTLHLRVADFESCGVFAPIQSTGDFQSLGRGGPGDQIDDRFIVRVWGAMERPMYLRRRHPGRNNEPDPPPSIRGGIATIVGALFGAQKLNG